MSADPLLLGKPRLEIASTGSTNDDLKKLYRGGRADPGTLLLAGKQTAGRGQFDRCWWSPPQGGLLFSLLLPLKKESLPSPLVSLLCGLALARAVEAVCGFRPQLKWPNDLLAEGKKCAGILCEMVTRGSGESKESAVVAGLGINGHVPPQTFPKELRAAAASLHQFAVRPFTETELLDLFNHELMRIYLPFYSGRDQNYLEEYRSFCSTLGPDEEYQILRQLGRGC